MPTGQDGAGDGQRTEPAADAGAPVGDGARTPARPHLRVACAIVEKGGLVLAAQRSAAMSLPLKWEFPGGKIREGEAPEACLQRELLEELGVTAPVVEALAPVTHPYPTFTVTLHPFRCGEPSGPLTLHEHAAIAWVAPADLPSLDWAAADRPLIAAYLARRRCGT